MPFKALKEHVLGKEYDLSFTLLTPKEAREITLRSKNKDKASNVLAFPLSKKSGEIFICPATARIQAPDFEMNAQEFIAYLFIHGLLHLTGLDHGGTMERAEQRVCSHFNLCKKSLPESTSGPTKSR